MSLPAKHPSTRGTRLRNWTLRCSARCAARQPTQHPTHQLLAPQLQAASTLMQRADAAATSATTSRDGVTTYRREFRSSSGNGSSHASTYYREVVIRGGPARVPQVSQVTQVPILVLLAALAGAWFAATRRFLANYQCTLYVRHAMLASTSTALHFHAGTARSGVCCLPSRGRCWLLRRPTFAGSFRRRCVVSVCTGRTPWTNARNHVFTQW